MALDLTEILSDWNCPDGEVAARLIRGRDGSERLQLRIELGVLQMTLDDRPDGTRYRGMTNVLEFVEHELRRPGGRLDDSHWEELEREFSQYNYRRVALTCLVDGTRGTLRGTAARPYLVRALRDVDVCQRIVDLFERLRGPATDYAQHRPALAFNRSRLCAQLRIVDEQYDEAVEEVARGRKELDALLTEAGLELEDRDRDPGLAYLRDLEQQIRTRFGITLTLRERLEAAIEAEDFETAAALRDELRKREARLGGLPAPPSAHGD